MTDSPILDSAANGNYYQKDACRVQRINPLKVSCDEVELNKPGLLRKNLIILLFIIFQICGCGGGGSDDPANDPDSGPTKNVNVSGPWDGTATAQNGSVYQTAFTLTQDGNNIGGTCEWVTEDETYHSPDVSGTVNNSTVTISIIFRDTENPDNYLELVYSGTVDGSDISGDITITGIWDGTERNGKASFTLSRPDDDPDPNPEPEDNTIEVSDDIEEPTTWENQYVYVISEDLYVENTLTIQAGTVIKFQFGTDVKVQGEGIIIAQGAPDEPVVFTSYADDEQGGDTNKDANASTPTMADWEGIIIYETQGSVFDYCHFLYGGVSRNNSPLKLDDSQATISNCEFAHNGGGYYSSHYYGALDATNARLGTIISNNQFYDNIIPLSINQNYDLDNTNTFHDASGTMSNTYNAIFFQTYDSANKLNGDIDRNLRWEETEVAIVIDLLWCRLLANTSLTLGDNVVLKFIGDSQFNLFDGETALNNHDGNGVFFTSFRDDALKGDSNGNGDATSPTENDWVGFVSGEYSNGPAITGWSNVFYADNINNNQ